MLLMALLASTSAATAAAAADHDSAHAQKPRKNTRSAAEQAFGRVGDPRKVKRVIHIDMSDTMRFFPGEVRMKRGDTVRFELRNSGVLHHEMVIGSMDHLKKHAALMKRNGGVGDVDASAVHAAPGEKASMVWHFTKPGEFYYGCLVPGHFDAGMIGTIVVR